MSDSIKSLKGVTADLAGKLGKEDINTVDELLASAADQGNRRALASKLGIELSALTEIVNRADLARLDGVAGVYADLLENAGVDSCKEMAQRIPANLHAKLEEVNDKMKLTQRVPTLSAVEGWVAQAKKFSNS